MKKKIAVLSIIFVILLVANTPAKLVEYLLPPQKNVLLSGFDGTIWSGQVSQVMFNDILLQDVDFSISMLSLVLFDPQVYLQISRGDIQGEFILHVNSDMENDLYLEDVTVQMDATLLEKFIPVRGVVLSGKISTAQLNFELQQRRPVLLDGQIEWLNSALQYSGQNFQLGDFSLFGHTDADTQTIIADIAKTKNALGLEGNLKLASDGTVEINGSIATDIDTTIYKTLALFNNGKPENGRLPIKFKQKLF